MAKKKDHSLVELARWTVVGSEMPGAMEGCTNCGLVMIKDRRGTLLVYGGLGTLHKHLSATQGVPPCAGTVPAISKELNGVVRTLTAKHDPRFQVVRRVHAAR